MTSSTGEERSAYDRVPVWDGTPSTYRRFETAVEWWLEAENLDVPYSLAARLTQRLRGPARARAEEFKPHELRPIRSWYSKFPSAPRPIPDPRHQRPEGRLLRPDDDDAASVISVHSAPTPGDEPRRRTRSRGAQRDDAFPETVAVVPRDESYVNLRFGIDTLMDAMKVVAGVGARDMQRTKAELLDSFHGELFKRKAGQSILDWNTDFRKMLVRLKEAQVIISPEEAGWKLKHRMGLSQGRMELLDVATGSSLDPEIIQLHSERLFRSIHHAEKNLAPRGAFPSKLASLLKYKANNSSGSTAGGSTSARTSSSGGWRSTVSSSSRNDRRAHQAVQVEDAIPENAAVENDDATNTENPDEHETFEAALERELVAAAEELDVLEAEGGGEDETEIATAMEEAVERLADAYMTMREAKLQLAERRKDRQYNGPRPKGGGKGAAKAQPRKLGAPANAAQDKIAVRKADSKCFDCLEKGHWAGDKACKKHGAGLGRSSSTNEATAEVAEACGVCCDNDLEFAPGAQYNNTYHGHTEFADCPDLAQADLGSLGSDLPERRVSCWADAMSSDSDANDALVSDHVLETKTSQIAAVDDPDAGASDSACDKTVCGNV